MTASTVVKTKCHRIKMIVGPTPDCRRPKQAARGTEAVRAYSKRLLKYTTLRQNEIFVLARWFQISSSAPPGANTLHNWQYNLNSSCPGDPEEMKK